MAFLAAASACNWHPISLALTWYGYIDTSGKTIIPVQYSNAKSFSEGLAAIQVDERWGSIDRNGGFAIAPVFIEAYEFSEGLAAVRVQDSTVSDQRRWRYGYVDRAGALAIPAHFDKGCACSWAGCACRKPAAR
jgi:hypothetical protein